MTIIDYFRDGRQAHWLAQIGDCQWRAAKYLAQILSEGRFHDLLGQGTLYLLTDGDALVSFLTLAERDCIDDPAMTPWIGFVHTAPAYRGRRCAGMLIAHAACVAGKNGAEQVYICTDHVGLYEKYGFAYLTDRVSIYGEQSRVLVRRTMQQGISIRKGVPEDLPQWMALVRRVAGNFPGLETEEALAAHAATVEKFIRRGSALCAVQQGCIVGVLLFSPARNQLCCMAVAPQCRHQGVGTQLFLQMLRMADPARDISVVTFREGEALGASARPFYLKNGFRPGVLIVENDHPCQVFVRRASDAEG